MVAKLRRIGFLADTHSRKADGTDLPDQAIAAFGGVDLLVHLGDIGRRGIIPRLETVAPVWVPDDERKGYVPVSGDGVPVKVIEAGKHRIGLCFNLAQPDKKIVVEDDAIRFPDAPLEPLMHRRFKSPVSIVAFGGTHRQLRQSHDGVLFFNPGSPTLPSDKSGDDDLGSVAILDVAAAVPAVELVRLTRA